MLLEETTHISENLQLKQFKKNGVQIPKDFKFPKINHKANLDIAFLTFQLKYTEKSWEEMKTQIEALKKTHEVETQKLRNEVDQANLEIVSLKSEQVKKCNAI